MAGPTAAVISDAPPLVVSVIVPDDPLAELIGRTLADEGLGPSGTFRSPNELGAPAGGATEVIVLGTHDGNVAATVRTLRERAVLVRIVVVGTFSSPRAVREALDHGADGLVEVEELEQTLVPTVRAVSVGQIAFPREARSYVWRPVLSTREKQILGMVVMGFTNGEIARKLVVAESTVKSHLSSSFRKLGVRSRTEASELILDPERGLGTGILAISEGEATVSAEVDR